MKKIATKFSAIALTALIALTSCNKKKNTPPEQDLEFKSAIDASAATMIASDIGMMVAQSSEYSYLHFYALAPNPAPGSAVIVNRNDTLNKKITITFINAKCRDGKVRNGQMLIDFSKTYPTGTVTASGQTYIRNPHHMSTVQFFGYSVNQFKLKNESTFSLANTTPAGYTRSVTPITWKLQGDLLVLDTTKSDSDLEMHWKGTFTKTLVNSTSNTIHPATNMPLVWTTTNNALPPKNAINGIVRYSGTATGFTNRNQNFTFKIEDDKQVERDFGCSPDFYINPGHHPFVNGKVKFSTGDKSDRWLFFGDESGNKYCDNSGVLYIESLSYKIDFIQ